MIVTSIKTQKVLPGDKIEDILVVSLPQLEENTVVVISAKIIAICEGNIVKNDGSVTKEELIIKEADRYIKDERFYEEKKTVLTVKNHLLIPSSGIDESNGNGYFILWPKDPMASAKKIWEFLKSHSNLQHVGVLLTDSYFVPMRRGAVGVGIAWCGFEAVSTFIGHPDIFGEKLKYTKSSNIDGLAAAATATMGEADQQTPLALITDIPFVPFQERPPTQDERKEMEIVLEDDSFAPLLTAAKWESEKK